VDPRVNPEACRRLKVSSMLMAPISDGKQNLGIVEVFSNQRNAFTEEDVRTLQILAQRVADSKKASEEGLKAGAPPTANSGSPVEIAMPSSIDVDSHESEPPAFLPEEPRKGEFLTSVLVVSVITVAVVLGVVIGVGFTKRNAPRSTARGGAVSAKDATQPETRTSPQSGTPTSAASESSAADSVAQKLPSTVPVEPPAGGLIVTQNGKVIYRSDSPVGSAASGAPEKSSSRLIHRVNPIYPEAARTQHIEGSVILNAHVLGDGSVGEIEIMAGDPLLAEAATRAVRQWKFQPYSVNGQPVERQERITVRFSLPQS
jgi:TonB family protein